MHCQPSRETIERVDAQEIKAAVAHQDAARAAADDPVRQPARPRARARPRRPPGGQPARPDRGRTSPTRSGTTGAGSSSNRVNDLDEIEQILNLTDEEREGLSAPDKFRVDITPYFISLIDPDDPNDPIRRQVIPLGREQQAFTAMMEDSLAEDRHSPVPGPRPPLPGPGADAGHDPVRELLPLLHPVPDRRRPDPELQPHATTRRSSTTCAARRRCATC